MSPWTWMLCAFGVLSTCLKCGIEGYDKFNSVTKLRHLAVDNTTGRVYLGAVNYLYQLTDKLQKEEELKTGPEDDDPSCVPPINSNCKTAVKTDNYNTLLLIDKTNNSLVICGSIYRGICSLWHLNNISKVIYENVNGGEATFVASNDSTVGLITFMNEADNKSKVIFIGKTQATYSSTIISTRTLSPTGMLIFFEPVQDTSAVKPDSILQYRHDFRFSFKHEKFVYFIFSRIGRLQHEPKTYISRICLSDVNYYSYIEMVLECGEFNLVQSAYITSPGKDLIKHMNETGDYGTLAEQDKVLFAVFNRGNQKTASPKHSAFCMFSLRQINEKIEEFREICYSHKGEQNGETIIYNPYKTERKTSCTMMNKNQAVQYPCSGEHLPYPIASKKGISAKAQKEYNTNLSAIAVTVENSNTIVFLGSAVGEIHKVFLHIKAEEYQTISMSSRSPVNSDLVFDAKRDHLYVMTDKEVTRLPVQECIIYQTCDSCIASKDPYCGWCAAEGICSRRSHCPKADEKDHWLWSLNNSCVAVISAVPQSMSRNAQGPVQLNIDPFPALTSNDKIECYFDRVRSTVLNYTEGSVTCLSPPVGSINFTLLGQDYAVVQVYVQYVSGGKNVTFTRTNYSFYDCNAAMKLFPNIPCGSCVGSNWTCHWDMAENMCKDGSGEDQPNIVKSKMAEKCPQFGDPTPSLIPVDVEEKITFKGKNLDFYREKKMTLVITNQFTDKTFRVNKTTSDTFSSAIKLHYNKNDTLTLCFSVRVEGKAVDSRLDVTLHNCEYSNTDCSLCLSAEQKYNCVWCNNKDTKKCVYKELCKVPIENANSCPAPTISQLDPTNGPLKGGILLTIKGSNLGKTADDIKEIKVGKAVCNQDKEKYSTSVRVVCTLGEVTEPQDKLVQIVTRNNKTGISATKFTYTDPEPYEISPSRGIHAGGTSLTITGKHLTTGKQEDVKVLLGNVPCTLTTFNESLVCITGPYAAASPAHTKNVTVSVWYGNRAVKEVQHQVFSYVPNPLINDLRPKKSIFSGGRNITVIGKGFDAVQKRIMRVRIQEVDGSFVDKNETEALESSNDTMLIFPSPPANQENVAVLIILDNFNESKQLQYVNDPLFERFPKGVFVLKQPPIFVKGTGLNNAMTAEEVKAHVGTEECKVTTLSVKDFVCTPPEKQPPPRRVKRDTNDDLPEFVVKMGYREYMLGKVKYDTPAELPLGLILPLVLIPMLLIIGVSVYCYRRKSQQAEREYKKIQLQLESLEESVRDRCKKEFTDLVTEMEDHSNDVNDVGIPFLDYKTYTDRVFFLPSKDGENDVMITGKLDIPEARRQTVEVALNQFSNLLNSKSFLIHFVHTLESQKDFSAREKVYFASLLTIALHGKLEYYTDIMRTLLLELMEQYVAKNPKLMLRRSETVVERMLSNWMSICLYQFLKDSAGEPLYRLFKGLKHQVEKGPVDAELKKAKYTLNDTGLLGEDVEYHVLTLNVTVQGDPGESMPVKVLNCDSITQVKEKILDQVYRNVPFSQRPARESVVLEWRPGSTGQILSDLDVTSEREGKWRRINTLKHYNVRDFSTVILVRSSHAQQPDDHQQIIHGEKSGLLEEDRRWHLVRQVDEVDESKSKRGSMKEKERTKAITEIYLTRLLSVKGTLQNFVDNFFQSVLSTNQIVPTAVKYYFDFLDEQAHKNEITDEETIHIWKTNSLPLRFWVNILKNPHFIFDVKVNEVVDASLSVIAQTFMDACTKTEYKLSRDSPSNKLLYAREIYTYKKMVEDYYKGIRQMVQVSDQDMNTHLAEVSRAHTDKLNTVVALHQLYQYTNKYYDQIINALEQDPAAQKMQLAVRLQQIAAALENKTTDL
ncbi:plexin-B2-like [Hypanus sabinus]|uniref:plexin-B2-like n=1 Tax=Hypanus sabinus TaxID=79690 RepID=UPI0028C3A043|nr:plexin-B2-like [Hypanus sabinus]XP_059843140.1 plexin-B2-like [Hypanus sabinus]XP_059843142.1 plexin-B2-like [Hypanus sabinus]XP_059843143.1 plexin-B2-like [Hypanus sabinus]XP_059843144.1 plexin-B2-like [Hypanus sabinus]XP_059843145.1 plexin-B2-like [Hypanus sabinus]XP_059843146.1 plexin-B2-like [Hypanus sabinus]XP_059843147.1 plexin-B2-like [Hypanus sabinus]XP_059843148.1 plexin-B2-like [Hypanus sabinus]XP_059843149.1 plexin-B2-like [Hypanus sabinus]